MSFTRRAADEQPEPVVHGRDRARTGVAKFLAHGLVWYRHIIWSLVTAILLACVLFILPPAVRATLMRALLAQRVLAGMFLVFSLLALSLLWVTGQRIDAGLFIVFNRRGARPPWLDAVMLWFTQLGNGLFAVLLALCLFAFGQHRLMYELSLGLLTLWLVVEVIKAVVHRARPFIHITSARVVGYRAGGRSFPSGHTSQAFFLAILLLRGFHLGLGGMVLLYALAVLVGVTRMYVGAHYPRDVLGGIILGSAWGTLAAMVDPYFQAANW